MKGLIKDPSPFLGGKSTLSINMNMYSTSIGGEEKYSTHITLMQFLCQTDFLNFVLYLL